MKILIAPDKFKGSLSAVEVCKAVAAGIKRFNNDIETIFFPLADGGEGSLEVLANHLPLDLVSLEVSDPLGRPIEASYGTSGDTAFIELAQATGLELLSMAERNPLHTTSFGTGKLIWHAIQNGSTKIYLFIGGSSTNDGGMGIAHALGFRFYDAKRNELLPIGASLRQVDDIVDQGLMDREKIQFTILSDVQNVFHGPEGAACVYAPQKGASSIEVMELDEGLAHFAEQVKAFNGVIMNNLPGAGAAGGIGGGMVGLCGAQLLSGLETIMELIDFEHLVKQVDWVITGEGKLDRQSLKGKVVLGVSEMCNKYSTPCTIFVGKNELTEDEKELPMVAAIHSITELAQGLEDAMKNAYQYLEMIAFKYAKDHF